jgi:CRP-like cAMP-binding protein
MAKTESNEPSSAGVSKYLVTGDAGDVVFKEGEASAEVYIIQEGRVELLRQHEGTLKHVALLESGDVFGEMSLLDRTPREVTARAATAFSALKLDRETFIEVARENPEIPIRMLVRAARRLHAYREAEWRAARAAAEPSTNAATEPQPPSPRAGGSETPARAQAAGEPQRARAYLVHEGSGTELPIPHDRTSTVGRQDRATGYTPDVNLTALDPNRTCGRRHACITCRDGKYRLLDETGKGNGSFVNGVRVPMGVETDLADGDRVRFGLVELVFRRR